MFTLRVNLKIQKNIHEMWILDSSDDFADSFNVRFDFFLGIRSFFGNSTVEKLRTRKKYPPFRLMQNPKGAMHEKCISYAPFFFFAWMWP